MLIDQAFMYHRTIPVDITDPHAKYTGALVVELGVVCSDGAPRQDIAKPLDHPRLFTDIEIPGLVANSDSRAKHAKIGIPILQSGRFEVQANWHTCRNSWQHTIH